MGSPLRPTLAKVFLCDFEEQLMSDCPNDYKPQIYVMSTIHFYYFHLNCT